MWMNVVPRGSFDLLKTATTMNVEAKWYVSVS
jgi:hypothetical protein